MENLATLVDQVKAFEEKKKRFAEQLRANPPVFTGGTVLEEDLTTTVAPADLGRVTVAGVDGGLKKQPLHGLDLVLTRAVAAVFTYENGSLSSYEYFPGSNPSPETEVIRTPLERHDFAVSASLMRMQHEAERLQSASQAADLSLLDGSIIPHYADKPGEDSPARPRYETVVETYDALFDAAQNGYMLLAGVVEDSRGTHFAEFLQGEVDDPENVLERSRDTDLLTYILEKGERTPVMRYTEDPGNHPTLQDVSPHGRHLYMFYLKAVERDRPVRIDYYAGENPVETGEKIASLVYALSRSNAQYGIPAPIVEADHRAALSDHDLKLVEGKLRSRLDFAGLQTLRRENRPF